MTRWLRPACVLLAFLGLAAAPALGQTLYAITGQTNQLITINTATGAGTLVGVIPIPGIQVGLGFRGANLYSWDETALRLRQLDPATAAIISTIDIGSNAFGEGDVTFRADGIGFIAGVSAPPRLYRFDISVPSSLLVGVLNPSMDGLAFNAAGVLFGLKEGGDQLYTIDPATAATTLVGNTGVAVNANGNGGLAFDASGNLFAALADGGGSPSSLYRIDPATGTATLIGPIGFNGVTGLSFQAAALAAGVTITQSGGSTMVAEGGATDTYTVVLNTAPTGNVTITLSPGTQLSVAPAVLTFTPATWNVPQTVTVNAVDDAIAEGPHSGVITHFAASTDPVYNAIAIPSVTVSITDNDGPSAKGSGLEGSFIGSAGPAGPEGGFGLGGRVALGKSSPVLLGPFAHADIEGAQRGVMQWTVTHMPHVRAADGTKGSAEWEWTHAAPAAAIVLALILMVFRSLLTLSAPSAPSAPPEACGVFAKTRQFFRRTDPSNPEPPLPGRSLPFSPRTFRVAVMFSPGCRR